MSGDQKVFEGDAQPVIELVRVDVPEGQLMEYVRRNQELAQHLKDLTPSMKPRFWATFVGPNRSNVLNVIEHPSLSEYAANMAKIEKDPQVRKLGANVGNTGRIVLESALMVEFPMG